MKKKFINGLLMVAMFVGATSSLVSCKDYDDEKNFNLQEQFTNQNAKLQDLVYQLNGLVNGRIDSLNAEFAKCQINCRYTRYRLDSLLNEYNGLRDKVGGMYTNEQIDSMKRALSQEILNVQNQLANYYTIAQIDSLLDDRMNRELNSDSELGNFINELIENYLKNHKFDTTIVNNIFNNDTTIINNFYQQGDTTIINNITNEYITYETGIDSIKVVQIYNELIAGLTKQVNNLTNLVNNVRTLAANDSVRIDSLENVTVTLGNRLTTLENRADATDLRLESDSLKLVNLETLYNQLKDSLDIYATKQYVDEADKKLNERIDSILNYVVPDLKNQITDARTYAKELADSVGNLLNEAIQTVNSRIDTVADNLGALKKAYDTYVEQNNERVGNLEDRVDSLEGRVDKVEEDIETINGKIEKIENSMAKFISGIVLNGTYNPVFGEINLPVDVRSNILAAFHGYTNDNGVMFPADKSSYYASEADWNRIKGDWEILKNVKNPINKAGAQTLVALDGKEGNAGTLYLTVNPTNRNFEGTEFTMINSRNEESNVKLSPLKKSDHKIMFGWDRARQEGEQSPNGFYETKATITAQDVNNDGRLHLSLDLADAKEVLKDVRNWENGISATNIATTFYQNVHNVLEADAVKATWTDDVTGEQMSVVSQYGIGAVTVKPLGFAFMKDANYYDNLMEVEKFATDIIDNLSGVLAKYITQVKVKFGSAADYIESIEYKSYDPETNTITIGVKVPAGVFDEDTKVVWNSSHTKYDTVWEKNADGTFTVNIRMSALEDLMQTLYQMYDKDWNKVAENINNWIGLVKNLVSEANEFLGNVEKDLADITGSMGLDKIYNYVDIFNKHMKRWLVPNKYVQPLLLVHNNDGYTRISRSAGKYTPVTSESFTLIPTTYCVEVLAPAYKKIIVATKVTDAAGNNVEAARNAFNNQANMNTVIDGQWEGFDVTIQKGYNYEILYMALDYSGQIAARKYYLKVK